jgi:drug/metabolite transporter (DMT)-like permease
VGVLAIVLGLASSLAYGFADFSGGLAARGAHALRVAAIAAPASLLVELLTIPLLGVRWETGAIVWGAASGVASALAFALLYATLARGPMSVLSPITALVSEALPVAVGLGLGERLHPTGLAGLPLSAVAILLLGAARDAERRRPPLAVLLLAVGAGAAIALQLIALNAAPTDSGVAPLVVGRAVSSALLLIALAAWRGRTGTLAPSIPLALGAGVLDSLANLLFLYAVRHGPLANIAVITALYPAGTLLVARTVLGERLTRVQIGGIGVAIVAVVLLALP